MKKNLFSRKISSKVSITIIVILVLMTATYTAFRIGYILGISRCALVNDPPVKPSNSNSFRVPLFIEPSKVKYDSRLNFTYDSIEVLHSYRIQEQLDSVVENAENDFQKVMKLLIWTRRQFEPKRPDPYPPMDAVSILREIRAGRTGGFCAQYNYVFVQAVQSFGIKARYVTINLHEVTEVWIEDLKKWVCFDPYYIAYVTDNSHQPLSVYQIYQAAKNQSPVLIETRKEIEDTQYYLNRFIHFAIWIKNNHISSPINFQDIDYYKIYFYETLDELSTTTILHHFITSAITDLY
jgi:hypothetical protein